MRSMIEVPGEQSAGMNSFVQLREAIRYPLRANALFIWKQERGIHLNGAGVTRDMSTKGVFVYSMVLPPKNAAVDMEVTIPPLREDAPPVRIHVRGRIVRIESNTVDPVLAGFAVVSETTILRGSEHGDVDEERDYPGTALELVQRIHAQFRPN